MGQRIGIFLDFEGARKMFASATELCDAAGDAPNAAHSFVMLEWIDMMMGEFDASDRMWEQARERLAIVPVPVTSMFCDAGNSLRYTFAGRWQEAVRAAQTGFRRGRELSDEGIMSFCSAWTSYAYVHQGDRDRAFEHAHLALEHAPTVYFRGWGQLSLAAAQCKDGQFDAGLETLAAIVGLVLATRHELGYLLFAPLLAEAFIAAGEHQRARATIDDLLARADGCDARFAQGSGRRLLAELLLLSNGGAEFAEQQFLESIDLLRMIGAESELGLALAGYGRLQSRRGDVAAARSLLDEALGILDRLGTMHEPDRIEGELAALRA
jgi:tetratricopeptide (TPR) repeat protein